ncbi:MAG: hypothetical protein KJO13_10495, partial [Gammaproteobacteria bacterium]|nr:hypothetical protein [Gammaproteobacteria bacterium]
MNKMILVPALLCGFFATSGHAASMAQSQLDCEEILERWANDPDSVSKQLVDECKGIKGSVVPAIVPFAGAATEADAQATATAADPCAGPDSAGSVRCWGPWKSLAPAAGAAIEPPVLVPAEEYPLRPELAEQFGPDVGSCEPGTPCGFATVVDGVSNVAPAEETTFADFELATDGSEFVVSQSAAGEIESVSGMTATFTPRADDFENMRSSGATGSERSRLVARVIRNGDGEITEAADIWAHGDAATGVANSGFFAWGSSTTQADLDRLNGSSASVAFNGVMSVDNSTVAAVTLNFGSQPSWSGTWTNPGYAFDAGGAVLGADMISDASQFSSNVGPSG